MNYNLKKPCDNCPFRSDKLFRLTPTRAEEIAFGDGEFPCHKTVDYSENGEGKIKDKSEHCAGLLIMLENMGQPTQMMRVAERIGMYKPDDLEMDAPVYFDAEDYLQLLEAES